MKAKKGIHSGRRLHDHWDNPEDTINVKNDIKVGKGIETAKNIIAKQYSPEKKNRYLSKPI